MSRKTSEKIEFHPELGVHKTYKGYKWQPGFGDTLIDFIRPGRNKMEFVWVRNREQFFKMIDKGEL